MKSLIIALVVVCNLPLVAKATNFHTFLVLSPNRPAHCEYENESIVNVIYDLQKVSEDANTVSYRFKTAYGACENRLFYPFPLSAKDSKVFVLKNKEKNAPYGYVSFYDPDKNYRFALSDSTDANEADTLVVNLRVDKNAVAISDVTRMSNDAAMYIRPDSSLYLSFSWTLRLIKSEASTVISFGKP